VGALIYGGLCYVLFLLTFLYAIGFVGNMIVPKSIDSGTLEPIRQALAVDIILLGLFAVQHSVMARQGFKRWWTQFVPQSVERSTYVLLSSLALILLYWQWRPLPDVLWSMTHPIGASLLVVLFWLGWVIVLISTFLINHFEFVGLQQVWAHWRGTRYEDPGFHTPLFYKVVRRPLYFGLLLAFWATPVMTYGQLLFAIANSGYIFIGILLEDETFVAFFGEAYVQYRKRVSMIVPMPPRGG
jgi:methanethiol S-methyltransferase